MGKTKGGRGDSRLVNMSPPPEPEVYRPPARHVCDERIYEVELTPEGDLVVQASWRYRGRVVDFSIVQKVRAGDSFVVVARIDCCKGFVHRHQFNRAGEDLYDHRMMCVIPATDGWSVVDDWFNQSYDIMMDEWEENLRRWRG